MIKDGEPESALIGPWGATKRTPRHAAPECGGQHRASARVTVCLDIVPDDDNPSATLSAQDEAGELLAQVRVAPSFQLKRSSALAWVESGFARPGER